MAASAKARAAPSLFNGPTESTLQPLATTAARRPTSERSGVPIRASAKARPRPRSPVNQGFSPDFSGFRVVATSSVGLRASAPVAATAPITGASAVPQPESAKSTAVIAARTRYAIIAGVLAGDRGDGKAGAPLRLAITRCREPWRGPKAYADKWHSMPAPLSGPGRADLHLGQGQP